MPNTTSAKKRLRQDKVRRLRHRDTKSSMRTQIRKVRAAAQAGDVEKAEQEFRVAAKRLDQAGAHRVIHPNKASRLKSRLQHMIKKLKQAEPVA